MPPISPRAHSVNREELTPREKAFVKHFLANGRNAGESYVATSVSPHAGKDPKKNSTQEKARRFTRRLRVKAAIEAADKEVAERTRRHIAEKYGATQERVMEELAQIAFTDVRDVQKWSDEEGIKVKNSDEMGDAAKAITEVTHTKTGIRVKMTDKVKALETLGKALGVFKESENKGPQLAVQFIIEK